MINLTAEDVKKFRAKFARRTVRQGDCLIWTAGKQRDGYGVVTWNGRAVLAHRVAYAIQFGACPPDQLVLHRCDTPACVAVQHLFLGTNKDNTQDMIRKGRARLGCFKTPPNARLHPDQVREIRAKRHAGAATTALAAEYGVHVGTISALLHGKSWRWVA